MAEEKSKKIMMTLKPDILEELDNMAKEWGTSRSGMVTILTKLRRDYERDLFERNLEERFLYERSLKGEFSGGGRN